MKLRRFPFFILPCALLLAGCAAPRSIAPRFLPVPKRLFWSYEPTRPEHTPLAEVSFVVESSTNQVDWIERARLAAPPFVFVPNQSAEFFRVAAYRITP